MEIQQSGYQALLSRQLDVCLASTDHSSTGTAHLVFGATGVKAAGQDLQQPWIEACKNHARTLLVGQTAGRHSLKVQGIARRGAPALPAALRGRALLGVTVTTSSGLFFFIVPAQRWATQYQLGIECGCQTLLTPPITMCRDTRTHQACSKCVYMTGRLPAHLGADTVLPSRSLYDVTEQLTGQLHNLGNVSPIRVSQGVRDAKLLLACQLRVVGVRLWAALHSEPVHTANSRL